MLQPLELSEHFLPIQVSHLKTHPLQHCLENHGVVVVVLLEDGQLALELLFKVFILALCLVKQVIQRLYCLLKLILHIHLHVVLLLLTLLLFLFIDLALL